MSEHPKEQNKLKISNLGIEELRLVYDREESRNNTFETKAASLFGFSSLLISILVFTLGSIFDSPFILDFNIISTIIVTCIVLVVIGFLIIGFGLKNLINILEIRKYLTPFAFDPNEIHKLLSMPPEDLEDSIIDDYRRSIPHFACNNKRKADSLNKAVNLLKFGIPLSIIPIIILLLIKIVI